MGGAAREAKVLRIYQIVGNQCEIILRLALYLTFSACPPAWPAAPVGIAVPLTPREGDGLTAWSVRCSWFSSHWGLTRAQDTQALMQAGTQALHQSDLLEGAQAPQGLQACPPQGSAPAAGELL